MFDQDKKTQLKDGRAFNAQLLSKKAPEPKLLAGLSKDIGNRYYSPRIREENEGNEHRERFRALGKYYLDGTEPKTDEMRPIQ